MFEILVKLAALCLAQRDFKAALGWLREAETIIDAWEHSFSEGISVPELRASIDRLRNQAQKKQPK